MRKKSKKMYSVNDFINFKDKLFEILLIKNNSYIDNIYKDNRYIYANESEKEYKLFDILIDISRNKEVLNKYEDIKQLCKEADKLFPENGMASLGPNILSLALCNLDKDLNLKIRKSVLIKSQTKDEDHIIPDEILKNLRNLISVPIAVYKGSHSGSFVYLLDAKIANKKSCIVALGNNENFSINEIYSLYGKNLLQFLQNYQDKLLAYHNKKMSDISSELGLQLPLYDKTYPLIYDDSISYTLSNVKNVTKEFVDKYINVPSRIKISKEK